jgi:hypothetical protein
MTRTKLGAVVVLAVCLIVAPAAARGAGTVFLGGWYDDAIGSVEFNGANPRPELVVSDETIPEALAVSGDYLYWESNSYPARIGRGRLDGSEAEFQFIEGRGGITEAHGLSVADGRIYWTETRDSTGSGSVYLSSANLDGSDQTPRILSLGHGAVAAVVTGDYVFDITERYARGVDHYSVIRRRLDGRGGHLTVAADRPLGAEGLVVADAHVYWVEGDKRAVFVARASTSAAGINTRFRRIRRKGCHLRSDIGGIAIGGDYLFLGCENGKIDRVTLRGPSRLRTLTTGTSLSSGPVLAATP